MNFNININKDDSHLNDFLLCWKIFDGVPNKVVVHNSYYTAEFKTLIAENRVEDSEINKTTEIVASEGDFIINDRSFAKIGEDLFITYTSIDIKSEDSITSDIAFFYKNEEQLSKVEEFINLFEQYSYDYEENEEGNLYTLSVSSGLLELEIIENTVMDDINIYYDDKTFSKVNEFVNGVKSKTINIFYGERGTGKTSIIKYIANKLKENTIIYIPTILLDSTINNPEFTKFLDKIKKPILVFDDCEFVFSDFYSKSILISNNMVQLVEALNNSNITIITIFNIDSIDEVDYTILDCNSIGHIVKFRYLNEKKSKKLGGKKGHNKLINIIKDKKYIKNKKIGF